MFWMTTIGNYKLYPSGQKATQARFQTGASLPARARRDAVVYIATAAARLRMRIVPPSADSGAKASV